MIIPVKCFTCGCVLADKYRLYLDKVKEMKMRDKKSLTKVVYLTNKTLDKTPEGLVLDELQLKDPCCRRHMLTHVDIE
jgi:DNA-directed RNA polymerase I, II, and III subunit RPABC5